MGASVGIRPKADGENIVLTDTHRDLVDDVTATTDEFGTVLGEGINEIAATAKSANDSAGELAARVKVLEERASPRCVFTATGGASAGWSTWKKRAGGEAVTLEDFDTRITLTTPGLYQLAYITPAAFTRQVGSNPRAEVTPSGGQAIETVEVSNKTQVRVVGAQTLFTVVVDKLAA